MPCLCNALCLICVMPCLCDFYALYVQCLICGMFWLHPIPLTLYVFLACFSYTFYGPLFMHVYPCMWWMTYLLLYLYKVFVNTIVCGHNMLYLSRHVYPCMWLISFFHFLCFTPSFVWCLHVMDGACVGFLRGK